MTSLQKLLKEVRACNLCEKNLPRGANPVLRASETARIIIIGQAPGTRVHATGIPWNDPSGDRLRLWLGVTREEFYDESKIAITPMGFCYPGKGKSGDLPPRTECAPHWHSKIHVLMPSIKLKLLVGSYAINYYLNDRTKKTIAETVQNYQEYLPQGFFPLPHPSPRNTLWLKKNIWFEKDVLPALQSAYSTFTPGRVSPSSHSRNAPPAVER